MEGKSKWRLLTRDLVPGGLTWAILGRTVLSLPPEASFYLGRVYQAKYSWKLDESAALPTGPDHDVPVAQVVQDTVPSTRSQRLDDSSLTSKTFGGAFEAKLKVSLHWVQRELTVECTSDALVVRGDPDWLCYSQHDRFSSSKVCSGWPMERIIRLSWSVTAIIFIVLL
ncbi:hypothetical protein FB45DRAFT_1033465 [Roridomyces roridus]|uniref:Uncharacterized protein n=1 Tax=Roridomyces roridus TaxID=1738132 RepID=A0AAD7FEQ6_9AGAR|nr:hypothetical protein FB45DRAFT_1033465 [Roridomyces roridus]